MNFIRRKVINLSRRFDAIEKSRKGTFDPNVVFHPESKVENLQERPKLRIGKGTHIRGELFVYPYGDGLSIGENCYVGEYSVIRSGAKITIGDNVLIAHGVTIIDNDSHEIDYLKRADSYRNLIVKGHPKQIGEVKAAPIIIEDYAWISYGVAILKGVKIGKGAIIGAHSVVTHDVPPFCMVAGNPARIIRRLATEEPHLPIKAAEQPLAIGGVKY